MKQDRNSETGLQAALQNAFTARAEARTALEAAQQALERAQRLEGAALAQVEDCEAAETAQRNGQADALAALIASGGLELALAPTDTGALLALTAARERHGIAAGALASLQAAHASRQAEAKAAEVAMVAAVDAILTAEAEAIAAEVEQHEALAIEGRLRIVALQLQTRMELSRAVDRAINPPGGMHPDTVPRTGQELLLQNGPHKAVLAQAQEQWAERRAAMIQGDSAESPRNAEAA